MKKIVYAITSTGKDFYSAMTRVSIASVRISNPDAHVTIVCDSMSAVAIKSAADPLLDEVDEWLAFDTPNGEPVYRNRYVKTNLRQTIEGPFLFLDSDTFVRGNVAKLFCFDSDIAGAPNHSRDILTDQISLRDNQVLIEMQWQVRQDVYLNGGVLFFNDTTNAHLISSNWHQKWELCCQSGQGYRDQPALNAALNESPVDLEILHHKYNAQLKANASVANEGIIWHYYSSYDNKPMTEFDSLVNDVLGGAEIAVDKISEMLDRGHPWRHDFWLDGWLARRLMQKTQMDLWERDWFSGHRLFAVWKRFRRFISNNSLVDKDS